MLIFLYGQDTYRSRQKLNEIIGQYKKIHKSGLNLKYYDFKKDSFEDFQDQIQQISIFKEKKLAILKNVFSNQEVKEEFLKNFKHFLKLKSAILFYEENEVSGKDNFFNFLKVKAKIQNFQPLRGEKLKNWVRQEFFKLKTEINPEALNKLIEFVGNDLWCFSNEIKKLVSFKNGKKIEIKDVELLVKPKIEADIFKTVDALGLKNKKIALGLIHKHLEKGDSPLYLLSMINFQFRNLLIIKDLSQKNLSSFAISRITDIHPYIVKKTYFQAQKFTPEELKKIYQKIFQVELAIKTGRVEPETGLDILISEI
ncbi:MAG: DNA polymerase III subunit delta [Candidatus Nealsonbacteria bacterium]|nr:DNA polymerase III subunit delta [Candidatus Nealsonbacteria bacterium]